VALVVLATSALVIVRAGEPPAPPLASPVQPTYPDLAMAPLDDVLIGTSSTDGPQHVYLRFSATLVNMGQGPLVVAAHRSLPFTDDWRVLQRIDDATGGYSERDTGATLVFAGDGHDHWHVTGAEAHQLETLDGSVVGSLSKTGFCFFDNVIHDGSAPRAAAEPVHGARECGTRLDRDITMGLSVGWGDRYQWYLLDQTIEITDVPDGRYRLRAIADPGDRFVEIDEINNDTWTIVDLDTESGKRTVTVVEQGPSA
jgi:hypothetical protein